MKAKIIELSGCGLDSFIKLGQGTKIELVENLIPYDAVLQRIGYEIEKDRLLLVYTHDSFEEVPEGELIPTLQTPIYKDIKNDPE